MPPATPGGEVGEVVDDGQQQEHRGGDEDPDPVERVVGRRLGLVAADHVPGAERAERDAVAAGGDHEPAVDRRVEGDGGEHPERARGDQEERHRDRAEARLEAGPEDRERDRDDEQIAGVVEDPWRGEVAPPVAVERADDRADLVDVKAGGGLDDQQDRRDRRIAAAVT